LHAPQWVNYARAIPGDWDCSGENRKAPGNWKKTLKLEEYARKLESVQSRLDAKPQTERDDTGNDSEPYQRRDLLRTPASGRVISGMIEFIFHMNHR